MRLYSYSPPPTLISLVVNRPTPSFVSCHRAPISPPPSMDSRRPRPRARQRDSDTVLRASVLDAAIELGIGNKTVAKWMFSPVEEGDEEEEDDDLQPVRSLTPSLPSFLLISTNSRHSQKTLSVPPPLLPLGMNIARSVSPPYPLPLR